MPREKEGQRELYSELVKKYKNIVQQKEAAEILGISTRTVQRWARDGVIKTINSRISLWEIARLLVS